jgi:hypothetical protein
VGQGPQAQLTDPEAGAERGEAVVLAGVVPVCGVGSCWERMAPGRHAADKHLGAQRAENAGWELASSAWAGMVGIASGGWKRLAEMTEEGVSVTPAQGMHAPVQGRVRGSSWPGGGMHAPGKGACKGAGVGSSGFSTSRPRDVGRTPGGASAAGSAGQADPGSNSACADRRWALRRATVERYGFRTGGDCHLTVTAPGGESARVRLTSQRPVPPADRRPSAPPPRPRHRASDARSGRA